MYKRQLGDDLCKDDPRLKYKWKWYRGASGISKAERDTWTHFQVSECHVGHWTLEAIQWGGDVVSYEAGIRYISDHICSVGHLDEIEIKTRIDAQIRAEELLIDWITEQYEFIKHEKEGH